MIRSANPFRNGTAIAILAVGCLLAMVACAGLTGGPKAPITYSDSKKPPEGLWPDRELEMAFGRYWGLRFAGKIEEAFSLEAPYFQETAGLPRYRLYVQHAQKNTLLGMDVKELTKQTERFVSIKCVARIKTQAGETKESFLVDRWVYAGGKWYHVIKDPLLFPKVS
jgi:hypothetical protein